MHEYTLQNSNNTKMYATKFGANYINITYKLLLRQKFSTLLFCVSKI